VEIFGEYAFRKWLGSRYERVMNRAIFDCIVRYFAEGHTSKAAVANKDHVIQKFQEVCGNETFRNAIEKSTKTQEATRNRLTIWGEALSAVTGKPFDEKEMRIGD
jgi:hypothetical protein